jgi:hypothetical protein
MESRPSDSNLSYGVYLVLLNDKQYVFMRTNEVPRDFIPKLPGVMKDFPSNDGPGNYRLSGGQFSGADTHPDSYLPLAFTRLLKGTLKDNKLDLQVSELRMTPKGLVSKPEAVWHMQEIHIPTFLAQLKAEKKSISGHQSAPPTPPFVFQTKTPVAGKDLSGQKCTDDLQEYAIKSRAYLCHYDNGFTGAAASGWPTAMQYAWSRIAAAEVCGNLKSQEDTLVDLLSKRLGEDSFVHKLNGVGFHRLQIQKIPDFCTTKRIAELQKVVPGFMQGKFSDPWNKH